MSFNRIKYGLLSQAVATSSTLWNNLIHYYSFEGNANDLVGSNDGSVSGAVVSASGINGSCYNYDGVNDYIDTTIVPSSELGSSDFTFSIWFNADTGSLSTSAPDRYFVSMGYTAGTSYWYMFGVRWRYPDDAMILDARQGTTDYDFITIGKPTENAWHHIVVKRTGTTAYVKLDNGTWQSKTSASFGTLQSPGLHIGDISNTNNSPWDGRLDEFALWNRLLTDDEVTELYNSGAGKFYTG